MIKKRDFYFSSSDKKSRIHGICWIPEGEPVKGVLQIAHGMVEYIDRYDAFARFLCEKGYVVVGNDHLGHGGSVKCADDWGYLGKKGFRWMVEDLYKICSHFKKRFPNVFYCLLGHSMGSFLTRNFLMKYGNVLDGAILMGTGYYPVALTVLGRGLAAAMASVKGWHYRSAFLNHMAFGSFNRRFRPKRTDFDWISRDEALVDAYIQEPRCQFVFTLNGYYELFKGIGTVSRLKNMQRMPKNLPVLFISGGADPVGGQGKGVEKVRRMFLRAGMEKVELRLYEAARHEILNEINREAIYVDLYDWLREEIS